MCGSDRVVMNIASMPTESGGTIPQPSKEPLMPWARRIVWQSSQPDRPSCPGMRGHATKYSHKTKHQNERKHA